jgi:spermidine synthase
MFYLLLSCTLLTIWGHQDKKFFFEQNNNYPVKIGVEITDHIESIQGPFEKLDIYQTAQCGTMLVLDDAIQLTQWDNSAYHEMIAHVPLMTHPHAKRVLIIGGGDGGALTEVLKHSNITEVVLCDIDEYVVKLSQKYFPEFAESFSDPRVTVVIGDGAEFIKNYTNYFDVILVDASDPEGPASVLYSHEFYQDLYNTLTHDGIIVAQAESPFFHTDLIKEWHMRNKELFTHAAYYYALVPTYPSGVIGFTYCAKRYPYTTAFAHNRAIPQHLRYYTPEIHAASFVLPKFLQEKLI